VKMYFKKPDYSKIKPKVDTRRKRAPLALWPAIRAPPNKEQPTINHAGELTKQHSQLCPPTSETGMWQDEDSLQQTGQLCGLPQGWQCVALSAHPHEWEVTQASIPMGGPIQGSHPDKRCDIQDPVEPYIKDDDGTSGPPCTLSGNRLARVPPKEGAAGE
jgi:hypothetical protein